MLVTVAGFIEHVCVLSKRKIEGSELPTNILEEALKNGNVSVFFYIHVIDQRIICTT